MSVFNSVTQLLIGIGVFLVGVVMLTNKFRCPSKKIYNYFETHCKNRTSSMLMGTGVTAITQSSTATSVIAIALINGGVISLFQATGIIMGANVGSALTTLATTFTAFPIATYFMLLTFVGASIQLVTKSDRWHYIGDILISIGIPFVGLHLMGRAFRDNETLTNAFQSMFEIVTNPMVLILLGTLFTMILQSSTAATGMYVVMIANDLMSIQAAIWLVIGANIGTSFTAIIASIAGNRSAKRVALMHVLFNVIGAVLFTAIIWPLQGILIPWYGGLAMAPVWQLTVFHAIYNVGTMLALIWFIHPLCKLVEWMIPDKKIKEDKELCDGCEKISLAKTE